MAIYSFNTTGSIIYLQDNISASQATTWNITQSSEGTSYFTIETVPNNTGSYDVNSVKGASGSFTTSSGIINIVADDYKMSAVVAKGGGQITFTPKQYVSASQMYVRGTGGKAIYPRGPIFSLEAWDPISYPGSGTTVYDNSGWELQGTLVGDTSYTPGISGSFNFDGNGDYIVFGSPNILSTINTELSLIVWFSASSWDVWEGLLGRTLPGSVATSSFALQNVNQAGVRKLMFAYNVVPPNYTANANSGSTIYNLNEWYNVAVTYTNPYLTFYVNGVETDQFNVGAVTFHNSGSLDLAHDPPGGSEFFHGKISAAQVYRVGLTSDEVQSYYNNTKYRFGY